MEINWGSLRRTRAVSQHFGYDRGTPVDRYYIEQFLEGRRTAITGRVLEIGDDSYTRQFGTAGVAFCDVLHVHEGNPAATIVSELTDGYGISSDLFDCAIVTQTLHLIRHPRAAIRALHRILAPGGTVLVTVPGITPISVDEWSTRWYWSFSRCAVEQWFFEVFGAANVHVEAYGNLFAATCFLEGIALEEITRAELDVRDPNYDLILAVEARKK